MKHVLMGLGLLVTSLAATAQDLPAPSPASTFTQRLGLTDIKVEYSRPGVKGRTIFGDLVPYNEVWRLGANASTKITFSSSATVGGNELAAGTYALFAIPTEGAWTVIFSKNLETWGSDGYDAKDDALRLEVQPENCAPTERLAIGMDNFSDDKGMLYIRWATTQVNVPIMVRVQEQALKNIDEAIANDGGNWRVHRNAANYYLQNGMDLNKAKVYIDKAIELNQNNWYAYYLQGQINAGVGDYKGAKKSGEMALKIGKEDAAKNGGTFSYEGMITEAMTKWEADGKMAKKKK